MRTVTKRFLLPILVLILALIACVFIFAKSFFVLGEPNRENLFILGMATAILVIAIIWYYEHYLNYLSNSLGYTYKSKYQRALDNLNEWLPDKPYIRENFYDILERIEDLKEDKIYYMEEFLNNYADIPRLREYIEDISIHSFSSILVDYYEDFSGNKNSGS